MKIKIDQYWPKLKKPISDKNLIRTMVLVVVGLSLAAGFYQTSLITERKKYRLLEWEYAKVKSQLLELNVEPISDIEVTTY